VEVEPGLLPAPPYLPPAADRPPPFPIVTLEIRRVRLSGSHLAPAFRQ
jgi:hypothetical protein